MSVYDNIMSGSFTSDGSAEIIQIRSDVDYMEVINDTQWSTTQATGRGIMFKWQRGLPAGYGWMVSKENAANTVTFEKLTSGGFTLVDSSDQTPTAVGTAITGITAANPPVITTSGAHGLSIGDIVRPVNTTAMLQIAGIPFTVTAVGSTTTASLGYINASGFAAAATGGTLYKLPNEPLFDPRVRYITAITAANPAVITMSVTHGYIVGEVVSFRVPSAFGMDEMDGLTGEITAINTSTNTITVDIDSSGFTAFAFPTSAVAAAGVSWPQVVPVGAANVSGAEETNTGYIGIKLAAGADSPAGSTSDVIYWRAFKSTNV